MMFEVRHVRYTYIVLVGTERFIDECDARKLYFDIFRAFSMNLYLDKGLK